MKTAWIPFNINHTVRVKLTDEGKRIHREEHEKVLANTPYEYTPPKEDKDGWSEWQLWVLMDYFGEHTNMANKTCFMPEIQFKKEDMPQQELEDLKEENRHLRKLIRAWTDNPVSKIYDIRIVREPPGVVSEKACWIAFCDCYMYGGCDTLDELLRDITDNWEDERKLVG